VDAVRTGTLTVTNTGDSDGGDSVTLSVTIEATGIYE
jgi:hypothetical protein